jgi:endonuclease-3
MSTPRVSKSRGPKAKTAGRVRPTRAAVQPTRQLKARTRRLLAGLHELYPDVECELDHRNALELLVATILSAQCTDVRVNQVTTALFARYSTALDYATADPAEVEALIRPTGFFRNKCKSLIGLGRALTDGHDGVVPDHMDALVKLPGVGRKTANVLLGTWFGKPAIPVDTHVTRLSHRLGLSAETDAVKIEYALQKIVPEEQWTFSSHALIWHGRRICKARTPNCEACTLSKDCPFPKKK